MFKESKSFIINYSCRNHESLLITTLLVLGLIFYYNNKKRKKRNCVIKHIRIIILSLLHIMKNKLFRVRLKTAFENTFNNKKLFYVLYY